MREKERLAAGPAKSQTTTSSNAGPTPFHHRSSYLYLGPKRRFRWLIFDNDGSFNGWFDWLPLWMRVGYWNPFVVLVIALVYVAVVRFKPRPLEFSALVLDKLGEDDGARVMGMPRATAVDLLIFVWGIFVMVRAKITLGSLGAFPLSFTGWSWILLTSRAGLEFSAWAAVVGGRGGLASRLATVGSSLRFAVIANACVVCAVWNLVLLPIIYFKSVPPGEKRRGFLRFNFGFFMTNIHLLNLPLAYTNVLGWGRVRPFDASDLWVAYVVVALYSVLYFFVMDRLGMHFYPIFNPRTAFSVASIVAILCLYYFLFLRFNSYVSPRNDI